MFRYMFGVWLSDGSLIKALIIAVYLVRLVLYRPDRLQVKVLRTANLNPLQCAIAWYKP